MAELPPPRRIVTGHNDKGLAVVTSDNNLTVQSFPGNNGLRAVIAWATESVPSKDNNASVDGGTRAITRDMGLISPNGTNFTLTELGPGAVTPWHRTSSIDHNILIQGILILMLDDGTEKVLDKPGDVVIQRGTMHAWRNPSSEWTRWACVLVDADPAVVDGKPLAADAKGV